MKVVIKNIIDWDTYGRNERTEVYVDGIYIGQGNYQGEPEDNTIWRDYKWVPVLLNQLATKLGADSVIEEVEERIIEEVWNV